MGAGIRLDRVSFGYNGTDVFTGLTLAIPTSAATALVGSNGSGKSTLLGLIAGTLRPVRGTVDLGGTTDVALATQHSPVGDAFPITVAEVVGMGRWRRLGLLRRASRADREIVDFWITELGLDEVRERRLGDLSGGQRHRALLAQTFAQEAPIVLLDEPTVDLDAQARSGLMRQLDRLVASGSTVVTATHDVEMVRRMDHCISLDQPRSTGCVGSEHHSDQEPGYSAASTPAAASAATTTDAVTPDPQ